MATGHRFLEVEHEDATVISPLHGLFTACGEPKQLEDALEPLAEVLETDLPLYCRLARRKARQVLAPQYHHLTENLKSYIVMYTMEFHPREASVYFALNQALRRSVACVCSPRSQGCVQLASVQLFYIGLVMHMHGFVHLVSPPGDLGGFSGISTDSHNCSDHIEVSTHCDFNLGTDPAKKEP